MGIRLSPEESWAKLAESHTGIFVSLKADGSPIALPVWFVALGERIYIAAPAHTKKLVRLRNDPRVSFLVESGTMWAELSGVQLTGYANIIESGETFDEVMAALDAKYAPFRSARTSMPTETRAKYESGMALIEIVPDDRVLTWDNSRIKLGG